MYFFFFSCHDPATTDIYTLSLHDALPISALGYDRDLRDPATASGRRVWLTTPPGWGSIRLAGDVLTDRKSTRLNSSHVSISYAVFCLKKKKEVVHDLCLACRLVDGGPLLL